MKKIDYLLKYVSMETYDKILKNNNNYVLTLLEDNFVDVNLNINFLIKYGISNIEKVIVNMLEELTIEHNEFIKKIFNYEKNLTHDEVISLIENM